MIRVNFHLTPEQVAHLKAISERTGLKVAEIIRRAIDDYLSRQSIKPPKG